MLAVHALVFVLGVVCVLRAPLSAVRSFIVPRGLVDPVTRAAFVAMRLFFAPFVRPQRVTSRDQALAFYAPVTLLTLPLLWLALVLIGYSAIYWALGAASWSAAVTISRESLLSFGSKSSGLPGGAILAFTETALSLLLAAILVSYLPAIYGAFSQREAAVTGLETRAGSPPTPLAMFKRYYLIHGLDHLDEVWTSWRAWFEVVEETHTALLPLVVYRSPQPERSWITAAGAVLDSAAITAAALDRPRDPQTELLIRAGYLCLRRIAQNFGIPCYSDPSSTDPISVTRAEFDAVYDALAELGIPLKPDRDQVWGDFAGWRVNYDIPLVALAVLTVAPPAPWSADRVPVNRWMFLRGFTAARQVAMAIASGCRPPIRCQRPGADRGSSAPPPKVA
jgi:hypothetical protein